MTTAHGRLTGPARTVLLVTGLFLALAAVLLAPSPLLLFLLPLPLFEILPLPHIGTAHVSPLPLASSLPESAGPSPRSPPLSISLIRGR